MFVLNFFQLSPKYLFTFDLYESGSNQGSHTDLVGMPQSINTDLFFFSLMVFIGLRNWITGSVEISPSGLSRLYPCDIIWHVSLCPFFLEVLKKCYCSVISDSLQPHWLYPARLLCPWISPGKNTRVSCHSLHQGIVPTQDLSRVSSIAGRFFTI